ncbi:hypothetical protein NA56DRAFT_745857 [Hyaloscypha hepaticicola]|uniref:CFEM domain-containing protein n=1 Tax=Hyaloscypha hepaticicola TaxID=2082293 RepID=A0A2J6QDW2_9HELO|nr:hypothetical protein NA56DRAFT_745857 [Hyaloscypha hepaticicola]
MLALGRRLIFGTFISLACAQNLSGEPACATSCLLSAISAASCGTSDVACQCALPASAVANCLIAACNAADLQQAYTVGTNLCKGFSASLTATTISTTNVATPTPTPTLAASSTGVTISTPGTSFSSSSSIPSTSSPPLSNSGSSATQPSLSTTSPLNPESQSPSQTPPAEVHSGLSVGAKAGIGIGVSLGVLFLAGFGALAFWWGKRSEKRKRGGAETAVTPIAPIDKPELGPGIPRRSEMEDTSLPLDDEEKAELERRRRAAELEGSPISPVEVPTERAELEALRGRPMHPWR